MEEFEKRLDILIVVLCIIAALLLMMSCQSTRYVAVPQRQTTIAHQHDSRAARDSVFVHDSITRREVLAGDTVTITEHHWHTVFRDRWRDRVRVDSFIRRDTITVIQEVEHPPARLQLRQRIEFGALGGCAGFVLACVCVLYIRRKTG